MIRLRYDELLFYAACVCNCWCLCLCVCVCLDGRACRRGGASSSGMRMGSGWTWQLSRAVQLALRWCRPQRRWRGGRMSELWSYSKVLLKSLYYNSLNNSDTLLDCVFEPVYWIVDTMTYWFGVVRSSPPSLLLSSGLFFPSTLSPLLTFPLRCLCVWSSS